MRVVINRLSTAGPRTGVGRYAQELSQHLRSSSSEHVVNLFPNALAWPAVRAARVVVPVLNRLRARTPRPNGWGPFAGLVRAAKGLAKGLSRAARAEARRYVRAQLTPQNYDLYHEPNFIPLPCDLPTAITVHDLSVLLFPQWHPPARVDAYLRQFRAGLERCEFVFTPSEYVRSQVIHLLNVRPQRVSCVYPGTRAAFKPLPAPEVDVGLQQLGLSRDYFLYVGAIEPRKNLSMLLKVYCSLPAAVRERHPLVLAGPWGWLTRSVADYYESTARHLGVRHLGYVPEKALPLLYNGARCLLYPSHYEGFGFPPVEMLACGGAVLASDIATLREVIGAPAMLSPYDADGWRAALMRAATDNDWVRDLRSSATRAAGYSWHDSAQQAWSAYSEILGHSTSRDHRPGPVPAAEPIIRGAA
ncbi:group 1 glycosyl transferase : Glycosyl transferase group 1 OS=Acidovorax ebreus (strain TPSY) GN=Dtpsy_0558 PE=4 SV=1: Glycos_transf_1 [Gemmataceae bacterium]|nr:group 1 glycosyl transferase : Glycosyl transferase group 1 OS=Acidovorax ebreus (strain TPSY) GN=Dtpsy_0558 PE=4 SV=1: Glycos_transf_1 [Gemmataceae bacterium]VTU02610.1 group 1 glycosyl transferase : Glycosyl transferase group 1 OS=Acidovorax ebreus (strain TPSY) GN=Dtpsy_0558 PE=4 SV=1: Glycos_transf_1 [Gemmataceae bacterium]